jgi:hypothetical protein
LGGLAARESRLLNKADGAGENGIGVPFDLEAGAAGEDEAELASFGEAAHRYEEIHGRHAETRAAVGHREQLAAKEFVAAVVIG